MGPCCMDTFVTEGKWTVSDLAPGFVTQRKAMEKASQAQPLARGSSRL